MKVVNGITITSRYTNEADQWDNGNDNYLSRDITHITNNPKYLEKVYAYRLSDEMKDKVHQTFSETFKGTKKYHNYTRDMKPD